MTLSRLVGTSRPNLYRLFEDTGGVARYIHVQRVFKAHTILSDTEKTQSISAIAEDLCFADASSFSRIFKREFACSPSELRAEALASCTVLRSHAPWSTANFGALLRGFQRSIGQLARPLLGQFATDRTPIAACSDGRLPIPVICNMVELT